MSASSPFSPARPLIGFAAYSGTGKTTLICQLIPLLKQRGLRIAVIKHAHHTFEIDHPGKDSFELRKAGAAQTLVASRKRWALIVDEDREQEPEVAALLERLDLESIDLVLVEGFKRAELPKIELHRQAHRRPLQCLADSSIVAVASDAPLPAGVTLPRLDLNDPGDIVRFICEHIVGIQDRDDAGTG